MNQDLLGDGPREKQEPLHVRGGLLGVDAAGRVLWATRGAHLLLGVEEGELVGQPWADTFPIGPPAHLAEALELSEEAERGRHRHRLRSFIERTADGLVEHLAPAATFDLFEEALNALELADRLQQMSTALSATVTLSEALDVFIEHAMPALGGRSGAVVLPSRDRTSLEFVEGALSPLRVPDEYRRMPIDPETALGHAWLTGETVWLTGGAESETRFARSAEPLAPLGLERVAIVPMRVGASPVGMLVFDAGGRAMDEARKRFAEAVAQACAHAFERARLAEEERHMQAAIAASERRMRDITSAAPLLVWMQDTSGRISWINEERAQAYFGVGLDHLSSGGLSRVHPDDRATLVGVMGDAMNSHGSYELELRLLRRDGSWRWHLVRAEARPDEAGQFHWYGSATDIDDQKRTRQALAASEQRLRLALQTGRMLAWEYDVESDILTTTANEEATGISPPGPRLLDAVRADIHPDDQVATHQRFYDAVANETDFEANFRRRFADGSWHWLASRATCVRNAEGKVTRLLGVSRDVNEEKRAELRLRSSEEMFRTVSQTLPVIVWTNTPTGQPDFFNTRFWRYTGLGESTGTVQVADYVHPEDLATLLRVREKSLRLGSPWEHEFRMHRHDGTWRWHLGRSVPVRDETGEIVLWVGSATDIDDQKRVLAERDELLSRTQDAVRGREVFLAVAAHELRTPLTPLRLHVDTLLRAVTSGGELPTPRLVRGLEVASRQIKRLQLLVEALLDVSRIASGRLELQRERLDVAQVASDVLERHRHEGPAEQLSLTRQGDLTGWLDRLRVEQILTNLLTNAFRYGQRNPVHVSVEGRGDKVRLSVRDEGIGIAPADKERIFERFERAGDNLPQGGLGLGLWIVHQIVVAMGGTIHVESEVGHGSTFVVDLPRGTPPSN